MSELMLDSLVNTVLMNPWSLEHFGYMAGILKICKTLWVVFQSTYNIWIGSMLTDNYNKIVRPRAVNIHATKVFS